MPGRTLNVYNVIYEHVGGRDWKSDRQTDGRKWRKIKKKDAKRQYETKMTIKRTTMTAMRITKDT